MSLLPPERIERVCGFGMASCADGYVVRPASVDELEEAVREAVRAHRKIVLRGAGRSYGDAAIGAERVVIECTRMNRILSWDPDAGLLEAEAGVTIEQMWRHCLPDGFWPPVVSGTMFPTLAGALAMNIHGKNSFAAGVLGEHAEWIDVWFPASGLQRLTPEDELFSEVIGSAGLLGIILRACIRMKRVPSGDLRVRPTLCGNWDEQFDAFRKFESDADYMVSWIDCFAKGRSFGRGLFHAAWYETDESAKRDSLQPAHQDLPSSILGVVPKSLVWHGLRALNNRSDMRLLNAAKHHSARLPGGKEYRQSLVAFSFLLDYVPNWRMAYAPHGFIQYQSFVPKLRAAEIFAQQIEMQQERKLEAFLGVLKRHRPDRFLFSHGVDGYSLALDLKITPHNRDRIFQLAHEMNDLVLSAGGRFYLAKDSTLRPQDFRASIGPQSLAKYRRLKDTLDPDHLLTSSLAQRLEID